ncbi:hypothetical protein [Thermonema rossianum]|jgi:hypothetical protein|uniref:hypothetical protein n=1 Tax=Thermonema rossianum TaxID=55505 RepID=UPI000570EE22|nr:hypothetical protein [Thermonema rossianum]
MENIKKTFAFLLMLLFATNIYASNIDEPQSLIDSSVKEQKEVYQDIDLQILSSIPPEDDVITITTSCGVTVWVSADAFEDTGQVIRFALVVDAFFCG